MHEPACAPFVHPQPGREGNCLLEREALGDALAALPGEVHGFVRQHDDCLDAPLAVVVAAYEVSQRAADGRVEVGQACPGNATPSVSLPAPVNA